MNLTELSPVEIDTALAALYEQHWAKGAERDRQITFAKEVEDGIAKHLTGKFGARYSGWKQESADECRAKARAFQVEMDALVEQMRPFNQEYLARGGWERFYMVQDGHVHSSMDCSTCNKMGKPTKFGWLPEWSGRTEAEALEALVTASNKTVLCTVCYPTAPVAWTQVREDADTCKGSGTWDYDRATARLGYYTGNAATCDHCGGRITVSSTGKMRKHKNA